MSPISFSTTRIFRFGLFEADLAAGELRKRGVRVRLRERSFRILGVLLEHPGELVSREELRNRLWPHDTFVDFDHAVNNAVMHLRETLSDSPGNPRFIETVHRRGYRFVAPVSEITAAPEGVLPAKETSEPESDPLEMPGPAETLESFGGAMVPIEGPAPAAADIPLWIGGAGSRPALALEKLVPLPQPRVGFRAFSVKSFLWLPGVCLALLGILAFPQVRSFLAGLLASGNGATSLVVLPLENLSGDRSQDYFADGMTDDLIANLAKIRSLRVISRSTAMAYKGTRKSLSEIAHELKVGAVVEGTVMRVGDRVRITAELVQVSTDRHLWAETYESPMGDILALQNRVSSAIVNEIRINLTPEEKDRLEKNPQVRPEAYENYLKGRYFWNRRSAETLGNAIHYFEEAIREDPGYALAHAALSDCYAIVSATIFGTVSPNDAAPKARNAATRALALDPSSVEARTALATVKFNYDWDWSGADAGFRQAISLNPNYGTAYQRYSLYLTAMGRFQDSFYQINRARELDPLSLSINFSLGWRFYMARQYDAAIEQLRNTLDMDSTYELPHLVLGQSYEQKGDYQHAIPELRKAAELASNTPLTLASLARGYALSGNRTEAEKLLAKLIAESQNRYVSPCYVAIVYAAFGNSKRALEWLEKAFTQRANGLVFLNVEPEWDGLRSNPQFISLERRLKLL